MGQASGLGKSALTKQYSGKHVDFPKTTGSLSTHPEKCRNTFYVYPLKMQVKKKYRTERKDRKVLEVRSSNDKPSLF